MSLGKQAERRLRQELMAFMTSPPPGVRLDTESVANNINEWVVEIDAAKGSLYEGQTYKLKFKFTETYPFYPPSVWFIGQNVPEHAHIYSNGHICLSILSTEEWSPALSVQSVCLSIVSMLSSARFKNRPPDDRIYSARAGTNEPEQMNWLYDDETV